MESAPGHPIVAEILSRLAFPQDGSKTALPPEFFRHYEAKIHEQHSHDKSLALWLILASGHMYGKGLVVVAEQLRRLSLMILGDEGQQAARREAEAMAKQQAKPKKNAGLANPTRGGVGMRKKP